MVIKIMKKNILYLFLSIALLSCKTENKTSFAESKNDTIVKVTSLLQKDSTSNLKSQLIGRTYQDINEIDGFENLNSGGSTIGEAINNKSYTLTNVRGSGNKTKYIFLEENLENQKLFKILDILDLKKEKLLKNNNLYYHFCYKDGKQDEEIIAIAEYEEEAFLTKIFKAWRADRKTEKIIEIPTKGIKVENMDYGL